jgi:hypothetical protein
MPWRSTEYAHHLVMRPADQGNPRVVAFGGPLQSEIRLYVARAQAVSGFRLGTPGMDVGTAV